MTTKRKIIYVLILVLALVALWSLFMLRQYKQIGQILEPYSNNETYRIFEDCYNGPAKYELSCQEIAPKCPTSYEADCLAKGGIVQDAGNFDTTGCVVVACYKKATDSDKACNKDSQCTYGCNLYNGIIKGLCKKIESNEEFYKYECNTNKPGACKAVPDLGGVSDRELYKLEGKTLFYYYMNVPKY